MKTALKRVASLLMALIMILEVVAPGVVEARSANQNRATVSDDVFIPPDGNRIDPDQNSGSHLPNFIDPDDDGYYTPPQKNTSRPGQNAPAQTAPKQGNEANDVEVSEEKAPAPLIPDNPNSDAWSLEFDQEKERARVSSPMAPGGLDEKKFTIITRFDTSVSNGPIRKGQFFVIHLDEKLTVKKPELLKPLTNEDGVLTTSPKYDDKANTLTYTITREINKNIQVPVQVEVDYNTEKIDTEAKDFEIVNKVSGLGVVNPKSLLPVVVDSNGNMLSTIIEPGRNDVVQILDTGKSYKVNVDAFGTPVVQNKELAGIQWKVRITSDVDLSDLGLKTNFTTVTGSGLGEIQNLNVTNMKITPGDIRVNPIDPKAPNQTGKKLGIESSMHHELTQKTNDLYYTFYTPVTNKQASYMLDLSTILTERGKSGAVRLILPQGYTQDQIREATPTRVGMNNRTTIMGEFSSERTAKWTVTDGVSSGDKNNGLPLETRTLKGNQKIQSAQRAVYGLNEKTGEMEVKYSQQGMGGIPEGGKNPEGTQPVGTIAVYEYTTTLDQSEKAESYSMSGVSISKYRDLYIDQEWQLPAGVSMPAQGFDVFKDDGVTPLRDPYGIQEGPAGNKRKVTIPGVRYWSIDNATGEATMIPHKIVQKLPGRTWIDGKYYKFYQNTMVFKPDKKIHYILNTAVEDTEKKPATFTLVKKDSNSGKPVEGAYFKLTSADKAAIQVITDKNGRAVFTNITPGTYGLIETKAPVNYKLDRSEKTVIVQDDGEVVARGKNLTLTAPASKTQLVEHDQAPNWPDYMNAMHYGKVDGNGNATFYLYLKPKANAHGGSTDRDTRLNLRLEGAEATDFQVYDVDPGYRDDARDYMNRQDMETFIPYLGSSVLNTGRWEVITGKPGVTDFYTQKAGYQIKFPKARFGDDWGFLVKVTGRNAAPGDVKASYEWLTDEATVEGVRGQAKIERTVSLLRDGQKQETLLTVTNEPVETKSIAITKIKPDGTPLEGASLVLKDSDNDILQTKVTDDKGNADFGKRPQGNYTIEEVEAPDGYENSNVIFDVIVDEKDKVTYKARFKDGGTPIPGIDYVIENAEIGENQSTTTLENVEQHMILNENKPGYNIGTKTGVWEAYKLESYTFDATINLKDVKKGTRLKIQFDPNLNFRKYVNGFPKIYDVNNKNVVLAEPYFDYQTNLLTYVFNNTTAGQTTARVKIVGMIPDMYRVPNSGVRSYTNKIIGPGGQVFEDHFDINADYETYNTSSSSPAIGHNMLTNYVGEDGATYMKVVSYYNPLADWHKAPRKLSYDWLSAPRTTNNAFSFQANGAPAFALNDIKVYRVLPSRDGSGKLTNAMHMPLSYGVRPEQDPSTYNLVVHKGNIHPNQGINETQNGIRINYEPGNIKTYGTVGYPFALELGMPSISANNEGYVIIKTFKVTNKDRFTNLWRVFNMYNGDLNEGSYEKGNDSVATGSDTGVEIPKFYEQKIKLVNRPYVPGNFTIRKSSEVDGKLLPGATFKLTNKDKKVLYRTTDQNGQIQFGNLQPGDYTLEETQAPENFVNPNKKWQVTVNSAGIVTITEIGLNIIGDPLVGNNLTLSVTNKPAGTDFVVYKKGENGQGLEGAGFTLKKKDEEAVYAEGESNDKGIVHFNRDLEKGIYILEESKTPQGYKPLGKKWVVEVDDKGKAKVYDYIEGPANPTDPTVNASLLGDDKGTQWVDVAGRSTEGWNLYDNRVTGYVGNMPVPYKMGTRIIGINRDKKYVIQRYVINPEAANLRNPSTAIIHREKPEFDNMTWYAGTEAIRAFKLDKAITGTVEDIRLENYQLEEITDEINETRRPLQYSGGQYRMVLTIPATDKPIVIDVKVPYKSELGGVGTGMDLTIPGEQPYWKGDYYRTVERIKEKGPVKSEGEAGNIKGAYISDDSLDVTNEKQKYNFKLQKFKKDSVDTITGATFTLTGPLPQGYKPEDPIDPSVPIHYERTKEKGKLSFEDLLPGTYKLVETGPAQGYEKPKTDWIVNVARDGRTYIRPTNPNADQEAEHPETLWRKVDTTAANPNRDVRYDNNQKGTKLKTAITEVNQATGRFKQVYILNKNPERLNNALLEIHSQPEQRALNEQNTKILSIQEVDRQSEPDNIIGAGKDVPYTVGSIMKNGRERLTVNAQVQGEKTLAVTIESELPKSGEIGTGMDFKNPLNGIYTYWTAEKYTDFNSFIFKDPAPAPTPGDRSVRPIPDEDAPKGMAFRRRARSIPELFRENRRLMASLQGEDTLEIGEERAPSAVRASGWQAIDPAKSDAPTTKEDTHDSAKVTTKITEINKDTKQFKQVFLIDGSKNQNNDFNLNLHREPFRNMAPADVSYKVYKVNRGSTLENLSGKTEIRPENPIEDLNNPGKVKIRWTHAKDNLFVFEVTAKYTPGGPVGLGADYFYSRIGKPADWKKSWGAQSYSSDSVINREDVITYRYYSEKVTIPVADYSSDPAHDVQDNTILEGQYAIVQGTAGEKKVFYKQKQINGVDSGAPEIDRTKGINGETILKEMVPTCKHIGTKKPDPTARTESKDITKTIEFKTKENQDDSLPYGEKVIQTQGQNGSATIRYTITYVKAQGTSEQRPADWPDDAPVAQPQAGEIVRYSKAEIARTNPVDRVVRVNKKLPPDYTPQEGDIEIKAGQLARIDNKQAGLELKVFKKDTNNHPVKGGTFVLKKTDANYENPDAGFIVKASADEKGNIVFKDQTDAPIKLEKGHYIIVEEAPPDGYKKAPAPWKIEVKDDGGRMYATYYGPEDTTESFLTTDKAKIQDTTSTNAAIKTASRITFIDPTAMMSHLDNKKDGPMTQVGSFVQRIYIDTRGYKGKEKINVQITPKYKREEVDTAGQSPYITKQGVKTAYRTTYRIAKPAEDLKADTVLRTYDLSRDDVAMVDTARWRPFGWGFDEDQLNLEPGGVYFIDVEGFYDTAIITGKDDKGNKILSDEDIGKIQLNVDFYEGNREFQQAVYNEKTGRIEWKAFKGASYQTGNVELDKAGQKPDNMLGLEGGRIVPPLKPANNPYDTVTTEAKVASLYSTKKPEEIPKEGLTLTNEEDSYNITFSKHGRDNPKYEANGKEVTNNRLEGAIFKLQEKIGDRYDDVPGSYVSSAFNGFFGFRGLKPGRYRLMEVQAPKGYRPIKEPIIHFTVAYNAEEFKIKNPDTQTETIIPAKSGIITLEYGENSAIKQYIPGTTAENSQGNLVDFVTSATAKNMGKVINEVPGKGKVNLEKYDDNNQLIKATKELEGAKFRLIRLGKEAEPGEDQEKNKDGIYNLTIGSDGKAKEEDLPMGHYILKEIEPPKGYINKGQRWKFTVGGEGLDPYFNDNLKKKNDVSDKISFTSNIKIVRPGKKDQSPPQEIKPLQAELLSFNNTFTVDPKADIRPGDYFTLKLTDNIDLNGIREGNVEGLDLFADGVGTIAKGTYDKANNTITYVFTNYAKTYDLVKFNNEMPAYISPNMVKSSSYQDVGIINGKANIKRHANIKVTYDFGMAVADDYYNNLNMTSKITKFNPETGEFVHYFYINRDLQYARAPRFIYKPRKALDNLRIEVLDVSGYRSVQMPESFGVPYGSRNLESIYDRTEYNLSNDGHIWYEFPGNVLTSQTAYVIKLSGKIKPGQALNSYAPKGELVRYGYGGKPYMGAEREDEVYFQDNKTSATANLTIRAVNPKNKITFKKVDSDGRPLPGAQIQIKRKYEETDGTTGWSQVGLETSDGDGIVKFEKLIPGEYQAFEWAAPEGFTKIEGVILSFTVHENGKITRKITRMVDAGDGEVGKEGSAKKEEIVEDVEVTGDIPIQVVNHKPVKFIKQDRTTNAVLAGAKFEVHYKEKKDGGDYAPYRPDDKNTMTVTSKEDGSFELNLAKQGYYALKEIEAPKGYVKPEGWVRELAVEDGKVKTKEEAYVGTIGKDPTSTDAETSILHGVNRGSDSGSDSKNLDMYYVINPRNDMKTYKPGDQLVINYIGNNITSVNGDIKLYLLDKGKKISEGTPIIFDKKYLTQNGDSITLDLFAAAGGKEGSASHKSDKKIVFKVPALDKGREIEDIIVTEITQGNARVEAKYKFMAKDLPKDLNALESKIGAGGTTKGSYVYVDYEGEGKEPIPIRLENHKPIEFVKQDRLSDAGLEGAEFELYYKETKGGEYKKIDYKVDGYTRAIRSGRFGDFDLALSKPGYYALKETKAPQGYIKPFAGFVKEFVLEDGGFFISEPTMIQGTKTDLYLVVNPDHRAMTYSVSDTMTIELPKEKAIGKIEAYALDADKSISKENKVADLHPTINGTKVEVSLYEAAGGKKSQSVETNKKLVIKVPMEWEDTGEVIIPVTTTIGNKTETAKYRFDARKLPVKLDDDTFTKLKDSIYYRVFENSVGKHGENTTQGVEILNDKGVYPFTGGFGPRWIVIIGAVIAAIAAEEYIRRKRTSAPKGGA